MIIERPKENVPCMSNGKIKNIVNKGRARQDGIHMLMFFMKLERCKC